MDAMHVLSAAEMQACDRATTERFGVASIDLMRTAAAAVAAFAREQFPRARKVTVVCGRGNNGGDGMMTARLLAASGIRVTTLLLGAPENFGPDVVTAWGELLASAAPGTVHVVETAEQLAEFNDALRPWSG
jgi:NAD(P)H-hydrate epimerase